MKQSLKTITALGGVMVGTLLASVPQTMAAIDVGTIEGTKGMANNFGSFLSSLLTIVMAIAALAVFIYLIWGGIEWITSGGDKGKTETARNKITAAVIGLIVLAAAYAILSIVLRFLGFSSITNVFENVKVITPGGSGI